MTRFARPAGVMACGHSVQRAVPVVDPGRGFSSPLLGNIKEKSRYISTGSFLKDGGEGGLTRFARPAGVMACGHSVQRAAPVVDPRSGILIPPLRNIKEKSRYISTGSHLKYGGEGGLTRFARPAGVMACGHSVQRAVPVVDPGRGFSSPLLGNIKEKSRYISTGSFLKDGGEGGIRTPDTLPYTHFPGVLLQPLGHLTILYCCLTTWGATGRYYRELH